MKFPFFAKCGVVLGLLAAASGSAQEVCNQECLPCCCEEINKGNIFFASASFLYWQANQDDMELGIVSNNSGPLDLVNGHVVDFDYEFKPGFKLALGMNFDCGKWESVITYTNFHTNLHMHRSLNPATDNIVLLPAWQIPTFLNPEFSFGSESWKFKMDIIDWDVARVFCWNELSFRPFMGLRGAIIDQSVHVRYENTDPAAFFIWPSSTITQKFDSWGIGPRVGILADWTFCNNWSLFGGAELDILYTRYDLKSSQSSDVTFPNRYIVDQKELSYLRAHTELDFGLSWGCCLFDTCHIDLALEYGFQIFFNQNMFRSASSTQGVGNDTSANGNLYIQGLTVKASFDF